MVVGVTPGAPSAGGTAGTSLGRVVGDDESLEVGTSVGDERECECVGATGARLVGAVEVGTVDVTGPVVLGASGGPASSDCGDVAADCAGMSRVVPQAAVAIRAAAGSHSFFTTSPFRMDQDRRELCHARWKARLYNSRNFVIRIRLADSPRSGGR
jgi:hypothetical protein